MPITIEKALDTSSSANAIVAEVYGAGYYDGQTVMIKVANNNTGPVTASLWGKTPIPVKKANDQALVAGDIEAGQWITLVYNEKDTVFEMQSQTAATPPASYATASDIVSFTRTLNVASWSVIYNHSLWVIPKRIDFLYAVDEILSPYYFAQWVSTLTKNFTMTLPGVNSWWSGPAQIINNACISAVTVATWQTWVVTAWDASTFTITWTRVGGGWSQDIKVIATVSWAVAI